MLCAWWNWIFLETFLYCCSWVGNISSEFCTGIISVTEADAKSSSEKMSLSIEQIPETLINLKPYFWAKLLFGRPHSPIELFLFVQSRSLDGKFAIYHMRKRILFSGGPKNSRSKGCVLWLLWGWRVMWMPLSQQNSIASGGIWLLWLSKINNIGLSLVGWILYFKWCRYSRNRLVFMNSESWKKKHWPNLSRSQTKITLMF